MWAPFLEKAWAKVRGTYSGSAAGFTQTGLRAITGAPIESFELEKYT